MNFPPQAQLSYSLQLYLLTQQAACNMLLFSLKPAFLIKTKILNFKLFDEDMVLCILIVHLYMSPTICHFT